jgi:enoyl-CoA hydratase
VCPAQIQDYLIHPPDGCSLWSEWADSWQPLGIVDLQTCPRDIRIGALPPFPLIGVGDPAHPLTGMLDAVVEPPVSGDALIRQVARAPHAAAVTVQLLRALEGLPAERALQFESFCYGLLQGSGEHQSWLASRTAAGQSSPAGRVIVDRRGPELHIVLDRPSARNAIDRSMRDQLLEAFCVAALDPEVRLVKLRAFGGAFSMGGDLEEFGTTRDPATAHLIRSRSLPAAAIAARAAILDVHVQGACVGAGLEISAFAARLTASSQAWFQLPELSMGLVPGAGGCVSVPTRIGRQRAGLMMLSGRRINAETALRWGLIDAIETVDAVTRR